MDKENRVKSFEMIGWTDPSQADSRKAVKWLKDLTFDKNVYPDHLMVASKPPACVFGPEPELMRKMIDVVSKSTDPDTILAKFCDMDPPPPEPLERQNLWLPKATSRDSDKSRLGDTYRSKHGAGEL